MTILQSIILGIIEGITEFLPISSTFHLIFATQLLGIQQSAFIKLFEVFIQAGAILAVVFIYYTKLRTDRELVKKTLIAFIPTAILGTIFYNTIKQNFFESFFLMLYVFIIVGFIFLAFEFLIKKGMIKSKQGIDNLTYRHALLIGLFQSLAFLPGVSRAGAIILTMLALGYRRADSAFFSFILAIPTIFSASLYDLYKTRVAMSFVIEEYLMLIIGFFIAFLFAYLAVKWFIAYLQKHTLNLFGVYRLIAGLLLLGFFIKLF